MSNMSSLTFLNSGSFTIPAGVTTLFLYGFGGGGGGAGGCRGSTSGLNFHSPGGGGGGGAMASYFPVIVIPGQVATITIGGGGTGGLGGLVPTVGGDGYQTVFSTASSVAKFNGAQGGRVTVDAGTSTGAIWSGKNATFLVPGGASSYTAPTWSGVSLSWTANTISSLPPAYGGWGSFDDSGVSLATAGAFNISNIYGGGTPSNGPGSPGGSGARIFAGGTDYWAGGGGGGGGGMGPGQTAALLAGNGGIGGNGNAGTGQTAGAAGTSASANTGSGGGGGGGGGSGNGSPAAGGNGGNGGSGLLIVSWI
jgi:hypothetical protein